MSTPNPKKPKIALVHDFLTYLGGAERVLMSLHKLYPEAPIYTLLYDEEKMKRYFPEAEIRSSFLNRLPKFIGKRKKYLLPLMPTAAETFDLRDFDLVISSSGSFVKGIITKPKAVHISYCHTPTRFLWDWHYNYLEENEIKGIKKMFILPFLHYLRMWDKSAAERVDYFIANSEHTAKRIKKFYGRESEVIYPPADTVIARSLSESRVTRDEREGDEAIPLLNSPKGLWNPDADRSQNGSTALRDYGANECQMQKREERNDAPRPDPLPREEGAVLPDKKCKNYFLIVSRLSPYKKIDIAIEAFNKLELPLVIVGEGSEKNKLMKMASKNVKFLGFQPEEKIKKYYENCYAFIFPGEDDFGIAPLEAMSFGKPVLAYRKGGALETVIKGETGEFFDDPIPEILADGVRRLKNNYGDYSVEKIKKQAEKFSEEKFMEKIGEFVKNRNERNM